MKLPWNMRPKTGMALVVGLGGLVSFINVASAQVWMADTAPISVWTALASSADGTKMVAAAVSGLGGYYDSYASLYPAMIYVSTNAGATWTPTSAPEDSWSALASSADGTRLVAADGAGLIWTSTDSGATWTPVFVPNNSWTSVASSADGTKLVAAAAYSDQPYALNGDGRIYISNDGGVIWTPASAPTNVWTSVASSADGTKLVASAVRYQPGTNVLAGGIYRSTDSGVTWEKTSAPTYTGYAVASSADGSKLVAVGGGVYTSSDSGQTWVVTSGHPNLEWNFVASSADGTRLVVAAPGGIYASTDSGATWSAISSPLYAQWDWSALACSADGYRVVAAFGGDSWFGGWICSFPYSGPWRVARAPTNNWGSVAASADGTKLIAAAPLVDQINGLSGDGLIYLSSDSGTSWTPTSAPSNYWTGVASSGDGTRLVATTSGEAIFISTNSGVSWAPSTTPASGWAAVACSADGGRLVAAARSIYTSIDSGASWQPTLAPSESWTSVASSADGTKLAAAADGGIYLSTNSGASWFQSTADNNPWSAVACSADGAKLVAATLERSSYPGGVYCCYDSGGQIYTSLDSGASWVPATGPSINAWSSVSCSADGTKMVAVGESLYSAGTCLFSTNSGVTWFSADPPAVAGNGPLGGGSWEAVAVSADGSTIVAAGDGLICTLRAPPPALPPPPAPQLSIGLSGTNLKLSWLVPSTPFVLQRSDDLGPTNWVDVTVPAPPTLNLTNLHYELTLVSLAGNTFYRLKQQ